MFELPIFNYNPDLFWDAEPESCEGQDCRGPEQPGRPGLDRRSTKSTSGCTARRNRPEIGRTQSHGCVRMTNWDAVRLASLVEEGTPVTLR